MARLKDINKQIPGGLKYRQSETGWDSTQVLPMMPSLSVLSDAVLRHRRANPHLATVHAWRMTLPEVELEMEMYNAQVCLDMGWLDFVIMDSVEMPPPKSLASLPTKLGNVVAGLKSISDMMGPEGAVSREVADRRAVVCVNCPKNSKGDWMRFFTVPASESIRRMMRDANGAGLATAYDAQLQVCEVCNCPMRLKVHAQLHHIKSHMDAATTAALPAHCWIVTETP